MNIVTNMWTVYNCVCVCVCYARVGLGRGEAAVGRGCEGVHTGHVEHPRLHHQLTLHSHIHPQAGRIPPGEFALPSQGLSLGP